jgi:hypothetical protein
MISIKNVCIVLTTLPICLLIILDITSLIYLPLFYAYLYFDCNEIDLINISHIKKNNDFQCNIDVIGKYLNTEIQNIPCSLYDKKNNILIKFNHYNPNECFDIINSNNDIPTNYNDILVCIHISYLLWIITIIGGFSLFIVKFISEKYEKYDRYKDITLKNLDSETHII